MRLHLLRTPLLLLLCFGVIGTLSLTVTLYDSLSLILQWALVGMVLVALLLRSWLDAGIATCVLTIVAIGRALPDHSADPLLTIRLAATAAFVLLTATLLIGPWSRLIPRLRKTYAFRRHIGVASWLCALLHAGLVLNYYFSFAIEEAYAASFVFFGSLALMVMSTLAITSFDIVQKKVSIRGWAIIHTCFFFCAVAYSGIFFTYALDNVLWHTLVLLCFATYWLSIAPWSLPKHLLKRVNGWKQLHMLVWIAYIGVVIHAWHGYIHYAPLSLRIGYIILVILVIASHVVGLERKYALRQRERAEAEKRKKASTTQDEIINIEGTRYHFVCAASDLEEGKGKRVSVAGTPLALFTHNGTYFALAVQCPHQGGPVDQGQVVNGYVECPWHKYQFSVHDGKGPEGFKDCIPYYNAKNINDHVYVAETDNGACAL